MSQGLKIADIYAELRVDSGKMEQGLAHARQALKMISAEIATLDAEVKEGAISLPDYAARLKVLNDNAISLRTNMQAAYASLHTTNGGLDVMAQGTKSAAGGATQFSMALMQLGSAVDDAQYGFRGVLNNIPMIVSGLAQAAGAGGPMGMAIAGAASIAATAIYQLVQHWDELMGHLGMNGNIQTAAEEMKKLADETQRSADQEERYQQLKAQDKTEKDMAGDMSKEATKAQNAFKDAIASEGFGPGQGLKAVAAGVGHYLNWGTTPEEAEEQAAIDRARDLAPLRDKIPGIKQLADLKGESTEGVNRRQEALNKKITIRQQAAARRWITDAGIDPQRQQELINMVHRDIVNSKGAHFGGEAKAKGLLTKLKAATPEGVEAAEAKKEADKKAKAEHEAQEHARQQAAHWLNRQAQAGAKWIRDRAKIAKEEYDTNKRVDVEMSRDAAKALEKNRGIRGKLLANPNADINNDVRAAMTAMGYGKALIEHLLPQVVGHMRKKVNSDIDAEIGAHGGTKADAGARISTKEARTRQRALEDADKRVHEGEEKVEDLRWRYEERIREHNKPQFMGLTDYAKKLAVGGFETRTWQRETLKMQREIRDATRDLKKATEDQQAARDRFQ
ncbi:MAG: hypothetical protein P4L84_02260 [Isosphaeraceae bacterium]|nr:hypothetical protein [Isosphaeraceae bacterium]